MANLITLNSLDKSDGNDRISTAFLQGAALQTARHKPKVIFSMLIGCRTTFLFGLYLELQVRKKKIDFFRVLKEAVNEKREELSGTSRKMIKELEDVLKSG